MLLRHFDVLEPVLDNDARPEADSRRLWDATKHLLPAYRQSRNTGYSDHTCGLGQSTCANRMATRTRA